MEFAYKVTRTNPSGDEIRRFSGVFPTYNSIFGKLHELFNIATEQRFSIGYCDEEGDQVTASSDAEWAEAQRILQAKNRSLLRLSIIFEQQSSTADKTAEKATKLPEPSEKRIPLTREEKILKKEERKQQRAERRQQKFEAASKRFGDRLRRATSGWFRGGCNPYSGCDTNAANLPNQQKAPPACCLEPLTELACKLQNMVKLPENILQMLQSSTDPQFIASFVIDHCNALMAQGRPADAESILTFALANMFPNHAVMAYNAACSVCLQIQKFKDDPSSVDEAPRTLQDALQWLKAAIAFGFDNATLLCTDADLSVLRGDERFEALVASLRAATPLSANRKAASVPEPNAAGFTISTAPVDVGGDNGDISEGPPTLNARTTDEGSSPSEGEDSQAGMHPDAMTLLTLYPHLSLVQAQALLNTHAGNLQRAANAALEQPE